MDNGDNWTPINNGLEFPFVISLAINSSGDIFAGTLEGGGVYRSTDDGDNWTLIDNGLTNTYVPALAINASGHVFAGTWGGGVFRSTDNGDNWTEVNTGLDVPFIFSFTTNASGYIFAGTDFAGGVFRSTDNGDSWVPVNDGLIISDGNGASGEANLSIPITGPKGKGTVYVAAKKSLGRWNYSGLIVEIEKTHQRIDLLESPTPANSP
jgi:photosystem II stability/assembly factor-like uncharacterized protein